MGDPVMEGKFEDVDIDNLCLHPLDVFHKRFCGLQPGHQQTHKPERSMPSALELREVGIHLRKSETDSIRDIEFKNGVLHLPSFSIHDGTERIFLNLMAFERLHPDTGSEATAFLVFMDNIIDSERDVQLLRSKGIIKNLLSSDKEASNLFNILSKGVMPPLNRLNAVRRHVNAHCRKPWNRWRAFFMHAYLRNPCLFISLMAAVILLIASLVQTVYSVMAFYK